MRGRRLTACGSSNHPEAAAAVGEVVGHLQDSLAGSPQFALVLVDETIGFRISSIAGAVHSLLGPDLLVATIGPQVFGGDDLAVSRGSVVVWAICGVDVECRPPTPGGAEMATGPMSIARRADGRVTAEFRTTAAGGPPSLVVGGDGLARPMGRTELVFPSWSTTIVRGYCRRPLGSVMTVTEAHDRRLARLDHVAVRAILLDRLETSEAFVDGPSIEFPPLRAEVSGSKSGDRQSRTLDVLSVDAGDGSVELTDAVSAGDHVQLVVADAELAVHSIVDGILAAEPDRDRAVLLDGHPQSNIDGGDLIATAFIGESGAFRPGNLSARDPWAESTALVVAVSDDI